MYHDIKSFFSYFLQGGCRCHVNSLGSLGYSVAAIGLSTYVITSEVQQFIKYLNLPWGEQKPPLLELNLHIGE